MRTGVAIQTSNYDWDNVFPTPWSVYSNLVFLLYKECKILNHRRYILKIIKTVNPPFV